MIKLLTWTKGFITRLFGCSPTETHLCPVCGRECLYHSNVVNFTINYSCDCGTAQMQYKRDMVHNYTIRYLYIIDTNDYYECLNNINHNIYVITLNRIVTALFDETYISLPEQGFGGDGVLDLKDTKGLWDLIHLNQWMAP